MNRSRNLIIFREVHVITLNEGRPDPLRSGPGAAVSSSVVRTTVVFICHGQEGVKEGGINESNI